MADDSKPTTHNNIFFPTCTLSLLTLFPVYPITFSFPQQHIRNGSHVHHDLQLGQPGKWVRRHDRGNITNGRETKHEKKRGNEKTGSRGTLPIYGVGGKIWCWNLLWVSVFPVKIWSSSFSRFLHLPKCDNKLILVCSYGPGAGYGGWR